VTDDAGVMCRFIDRQNLQQNLSMKISHLDRSDHPKHFTAAKNLLSCSLVFGCSFDMREFDIIESFGVFDTQNIHHYLTPIYIFEKVLDYNEFTFFTVSAKQPY